MQIKGRDSIGTFLKQNAASNAVEPAPRRGEEAEAEAGFQPRSRAAPAPMPPVPPQPVAGPPDRIVAYLGAHGPSPVAGIFADLGLTLDEGLAAVERLESFGFVTVDRAGGKVTVGLAP